ncbi:coiled-coil domain-containing protein 174 [Anastrepha obliqua]|uniref:coiled-coil domain-containing protein 174 n=1 Tax=Anastrepha obliqua TaxID=95512 RepID=UPI00240A067F|nr:coiled-coil domain-containing protein 174 [Anastrepha obliqua]XP_054745514.1 coiled-coil domain-containing protein 174 [Anastrepha obliqua]
MNDPNKAISVNLSSLLSLKAELLRKQAEVNKAKAAQTTNQQNEYTSKKLVHQTSNNISVGDTSISKRDKKIRAKEVGKLDDVTVYEHEDSELLEKSKRVLEAKSKFYDRMTRTGGQLNSDDNCLVLFNRKHQDERVDDTFMNEEADQTEVNANVPKDSDSDSQTESDDDRGLDDEAEWVEYTDCLGRTRKCLRQDLEVVKKRDAELAASMPERLDQSKANWMINTTGACDVNGEDEDVTIGPIPSGSVFGDGISIMSKHDEQRANWERKEQENIDKADVHYQDVFFDEARQHGVGYYAFSTDEEERMKQQKELEESRKRTIEEQKRRDELRAQREKIIAERVRAAKNRQRARLGLPPLEEEEQKDNTINIAQETKEERKARKKAKKLEQKQQKEEKQRELERKNHVRPWDKDKEYATGSSKVIDDEKSEPKWAYKPERLPMSQEEWNEKKRAERITEFAPVNVLTEPQCQPKRTNFKSMPLPQEILAPDNYNLTLPADNFASRQTSRRNRTFQRRNYEATNEVTDDMELKRSGAAIPPPVDLEYVSPPPAKKSKSGNELERSIEAGLRFLRDNCDKGNLTTKSSWTAKADY